MKIGNSSSKYDYHPEELESDIQDKTSIQKQFIDDLNKVLYKDYRYKDNQPLTPDVKRNILIEVYTEFVKKIGGS